MSFVNYIDGKPYSTRLLTYFYYRFCFVFLTQKKTSPILKSINLFAPKWQLHHLFDKHLLKEAMELRSHC